MAVIALLATRPALGALRGQKKAELGALRCSSRTAYITSSRRGSARVYAKIGLFYSTSTGHTEEIAYQIQSELGTSDPQEISEVDLSTLEGLDGLVVGAPTWNTDADESRSGTAWDDVLGSISGLNLSGKPVAIYGLGDSVSYGDYFCDAIEEIHRHFKEAGANLVGHWPADDYQHSGSKAILDDGKFCGLPLDQDNEDDKTDERIKGWVAQLKGEGF